ncbi:MFS general substrate transporter [Lentithecium fluviatile CBS 122367]|uniref:MFS general substrate transporter n=1 Tax=Lentithecium fluviatile CBS 122367 TaxID=1168545 RepID=A0A6G1IEB3_9PLEO|nr:MFS general substrate transporter [Lentithecium fluviatile CBS 122367]
MSRVGGEMETDPLLLPDDTFSEDAPDHDRIATASAPAIPDPKIEGISRVDWSSIGSLATIISLYIFSNYMLVIPTLRLYEDAVCRDFYQERHSDIDEQLCKVPEVQAALATLVGWNLGLHAVPGLLTAVWYGSLADQHGRKPVLLAAMAGEFASWSWILLVCYRRDMFPIRAIWASAAFQFVGGGPRVTVSLLYASIMDSVPTGRRTQFLYLRAAMSHLASLSAPLLASWLMQRSLPLLFELVFVLWVLTFIAMFLFRETLHTKSDFDAVPFAQSPSTTPTIGQPCLAELNEPANNRPLPASASHQRQHRAANIKSYILKLRKGIKDALSGFVTTNLLVCFSIFFLKRLAFTSENFVFQYASKVLQWKLAKTAWIQSTHSLAAIVTTALLLPSLNAFLQRRRRTKSFTVDVTVARACLLIAVVGCLWVWRAQSTATMISGVFILGLAEGLEPTVQGISVSCVHASATGRLFTLIAAIDMVAMLFSGPLMGGIFAASQSAGSLWLGLIYVVAAGIFTLLLGGTLLLRQTES